MRNLKATAMRRIRSLAAIALLAAASPAAAQHEGGHAHEPAEQLGTVAFETSCGPEAQRAFTRGVAWLHSFEYEDAERAFLEAAKADPSCAMAHWGVAMSQHHPLWAPPTPAEFQKGRDAIARAAAVGGKTARERDYIAALSTFYASPDPATHRARSFAYETAMGDLHRRWPDDQEAAVFHALALAAAGMIDDDASFAREKQAAAILDAVLAREPNHPGVAHYLIHSYDFPPLAPLALPAARRYAAIAPASAHAQHMPSHIFTRLGLWDEAIASNLQAEAAARAYAAKHGLPGSWDERLHAMDYLAYAYLQEGADAKAAGVLEDLWRIERVDPANFKVAFAFGAIPARIALERRQWREAAALALPDSARKAVPWAQFPWAEAQIHFARAVGAARSGDVELSRREVARLREIREGLKGAPGNYDWGLQVEIQRQVAEAWAEAAAGRTEPAVALMSAAADLDDATEKHPVTPGAILPAREQLGELLLQAGRPAEALAAFEQSLERAPRRFHSLYGAAEAARAAKDEAKARQFYAELLDVGCKGDGARRELAEARRLVPEAAQPACLAAASTASRAAGARAR
jgi:tetratricopeptide (TPR) repeat protein